jgi:hypothetical protein
MDKMTPNDIKPKRDPIFGVLSILFPLFGIPFAFLMANGQGAAGEGWGWISATLFFSVISIFLGFVSAIGSFCRSERYPILGFLGVVANIAPFLWFNHVVLGH